MVALPVKTVIMGSPASSLHQVIPRELIELLEQMQTQMGLSGNTNYFTDTLAELNATSPADLDNGFVMDDGASSGIYQYQTSSWVKTSDAIFGASTTAAQIGLGNVDDTADLDKPISTLTQDALDDKQDTITAGDIALSDIQDIAQGVIMGRTPSGGVGRPQEMGSSAVLTILDLTDVDNTSDADKPISTATQTALDDKAEATDVAAALVLDNHTGTLPPASIADDSLTAAKYAPGSVNNDALGDLSVDAAKIADNAVTFAKIPGVAAASFLGRVTGSGAGDITELSTESARQELGVNILDLSDRRDSGVVLDYRADRAAVRTTAGFRADPVGDMGTFERTGFAFGTGPGGQTEFIAADTPITVFGGDGKSLGVYMGAENTDVSDVDLSTWTTSTYGTFVGSGVGPYLLQEVSGASSVHTGQDTSLDYTSGAPLTWSVRAKHEGRDLKISTVNTNSTSVSMTVNLKTGKVMESEGLDFVASPVKMRGGYWMCSITFTPDQTGSNGQFKFTLVDDFGNTSYTGDDASGANLFLPSREPGVVAAPAGYGGTRGADLHYQLGDDIDTSLTEGTLMVTASRSAGVTDEGHTAAAVVSESSAGGIEVKNYGTDGLMVMFDDGSTTKEIYANNVFDPANRAYQAAVAVTWTEESAELWIDGLCAGMVASPPLPGNIKRIQTGGHYGSRAWGGVINRVEYYPATMAPADLGAAAPMPALSVTGETGSRKVVVDDLFQIATLGDNYAPWVDAEAREFGWTRKFNGITYKERFPVDFRHTIGADIAKMAVELRIGDGLSSGQASIPLLNATAVESGRAVSAGIGPRISSVIADTQAVTSHPEISDISDLLETNDLTHGETGGSFSALQYFDEVSDTSVGYFSANAAAKSAVIADNLTAGALNLERAYARMLWVAYRKGLQLEAPAVIYTGGNIDTDDRAAHLTGIQALHDEIAAPLGEMAREWQAGVQEKEILPGTLFISQISRSTRIQNALAQWDATLDEGRNIIGVTPSGMLETSGDAYIADNSKGISGEDAFLSPASMGWRGSAEGKMLFEWHNLQSPEWFRPVIAGRTGVLVIVDFNGLNDTVKQFNTALDDTYMGAFTDGTYGVRFVDDGDGNAVAISGMTINASWQLEITLDVEPTGSNPRIEFGTEADAAGQGPTKGLRVGIRDNTSTSAIVDGVGKSLAKHAPVSSLDIGNVLASGNRMTIVVFDDMSWTNTLSGAFDTVTPSLDAFMAASRDYRACMASMPVCEASRTSFMSGMDIPQTNVWDNGHDWRERVSRDKMLPAWLKSQGVDVAMCGKVFHTPTLLTYERETVSVYEPPLGWSITPTPLSSVNIHAQVGGTYWGNWTGAESELQDYNTGAFGVRHAGFNGVVFLGFVRPHSSNVVPQSYIDAQMSEAAIQVILDAMPTDDLDDLPLPGLELAGSASYDSLVSDGDLAKAIRCYLAGLTYVDEKFGEVLAQIAIDDPSRKVMLFSDHGYHLGDKERLGKLTLWESACNATLMYKDGSTATVTEPVSLLDVAPTICDAVGVDRAPWHIGKNLVTEAAGGDGETPITLSWYNGAVRIRTDANSLIKYVEYDAWEMYDLGADLEEETNLLHSSNVTPTHLATKEAILDLAEAEFQRRGYHVETGRLYQTVNSMLQVGQDLIGTAGDDILIGSAISGGAGDDTLYSLGSGTVPSDVEHAELIGAGTLTGSDSDDDLRADDTGPGVLIGGGGDDTLTGSNDDDTLIGGSGDDTLITGDGADTLTGGSGRNTFVIEKGAGTTTITDMKGSDTIILKGWDVGTTVTRSFMGGDTTFTIGSQDVVCENADVSASRVQVKPD